MPTKILQQKENETRNVVKCVGTNNLKKKHDRSHWRETHDHSMFAYTNLAPITCMHIFGCLPLQFYTKKKIIYRHKNKNVCKRLFNLLRTFHNKIGQQADLNVVNFWTLISQFNTNRSKSSLCGLFQPLLSSRIQWKSFICPQTVK